MRSRVLRPTLHICHHHRDATCDSTRERTELGLNTTQEVQQAFAQGLHRPLPLAPVAVERVRVRDARHEARGADEGAGDEERSEREGEGERRWKATTRASFPA
jgi:hypothetical protein